MRSHDYDNEIRELRSMEVEEEGEISILLGIKAKRLNERVIIHV